MDTTWGSLFVRALDSNPSTGTIIIFLGLAITSAFVYVVINLSKNTDLTRAIISPHAEMAKTILEIRVDQLASNTERQQQGKRLDAVEAHIGELQRDVNELKCSKVACPNREGT